MDMVTFVATVITIEVVDTLIHNFSIKASAGFQNPHFMYFIFADLGFVGSAIIAFSLLVWSYRRFDISVVSR